MENKEPFDEIISLNQAAQDWHLDESTLRKAINRGKFIDGTDVKKYGKQWVIKKAAMQREYGILDSMQIEETDISSAKKDQILYFLSECFLAYIRKNKLTCKQGEKQFSKYNIWNYLYICYDYLHLDDINNTVSDITSRIKRGVKFV